MKDWPVLVFAAVLLALAGASQFFSAIEWDIASMWCMVAAGAIVVGSVAVCAILIAVVNCRGTDDRLP